MSSSKSKWEKFFKGAGIPIKPAAEYAGKFYDNRMRYDMLNELNKEVLQELGVKAIGDVIAILRHAKSKDAEISRDHSPSPECQITSSISRSKTAEKKSRTKAKNNTASTNKSEEVQLKSISMTIKADSSSSNPSSSKSKQRRKLSDRFNEYEKEQKKKKQEEHDSNEQTKQKQTIAEETPPSSSATASIKNKQTVFTIQLPSKPPSITNSTPSSTMVSLSALKSTGQKDIKPKKITLVPAQGKPLNRNKQSTSIFDRLDKTTADSKAPLSNSMAKTVAIKPKEESYQKNVFSRLGNLNNDDTDDNDDSYESPSTSASTKKTLIKTSQKSPINVSTFTSQSKSSSSSSSSTSKNVFSRLGDR